MNQKAQKAKIQFPLQLQMMHDEPVVDETFNKVERINAPYLNDMLSPVYIQDTKSVGIYDVEGNRYVVDEDYYLTRNGEKLFQIENKKFVKEDVTEEYNKYHDYDLSDDYEAYTIWNGDSNSFDVTFNNSTVNTGELYDEGVVIASRIRVINNYAIFVVCYVEGDYPYICIFKIDDDNMYTIADGKSIIWYIHRIRRNTSTNPIYLSYNPAGDTGFLDANNPFISIAEVTSDGLLAISITNTYGAAVNTSTNYFATYFITPDELNLYQLGNDAFPASETSSVEVINFYNTALRVNQIVNRQAINGACISSDSTTYYNYSEEGIKGEQLDIPVTYTPTSTGNTVTIDGVEYNIYNYSATDLDCTLRLELKDSINPWNFTVTNSVTGQSMSPESSNPADVKLVNYTTRLYRGQTFTSAFEDDLQVDYLGEVSSIAKTDWNGTTLYLTREVTSTVNAGWLVSPNIVIDDGAFYAFWNIQVAYASANNWNAQSLSAGNIIEESGIIQSYTEADDKLTYTISPTEYVEISSSTNVARSNSFVLNQNIAIDTVKLNNTSATSSYSLHNGTSESTGSTYLEYMNSNCTDLRYYPGTTRDSSFNYWGNETTTDDSVVGAAEDQPVFTVGGYRTPVHSANRRLLGSTAVPFNILYYVDTANTCVPTALSYSSNPDYMGTLIAPWESVDDDYYISANHSTLIYRDRSKRIWKITIEEGYELTTALDDRYIIVNTTSYWNMYDSVLLKKFHYATDYNNRLMFGQTAYPSAILRGATSDGAIAYTRATATGINSDYASMPRYAIASPMYPRVTRTRVAINAERPFRCQIEESSDTQPIDVYYSTLGDTSLTAYYKYSIYPYEQYDKAKAIGLKYNTYTVTSSSQFNTPNIFTRYLNGAGNNDMIKENYSTYVLSYSDQQPFFIYNETSRVDVRFDDDIHFFVLQGQFYAFMNEKIYSVIYSSGSISSQEAIVDCRGMKFVGNNPMIAFFWDPRSRSLYSFTGDANLQHIYNANKFTRMGADMYNYWYDETTQSIFVDTQLGLLVLGPQSYYLFEEFTNTTNCQFDNKEVTHITTTYKGERTTINLRYYKEDGYEVLPLDLETSFYGLGNNEYTAIDRWDIVLYDNTNEKKSCEVTVGVRSITDITVKSEERTFKITPDMYDKWSNSILLRYVPKLQKGQGIRLYVKSPLIIQRIVPHIMDMNTGTLTKRGI